MGWIDRLREAAYTSPSGTRFTFKYEDVSRKTELRTSKFEFPGVNGAYYQQNGYSSRDYPIRAIFTGDDHDLLAIAYEAGLLESGLGKLEHPIYGPFDVLPMGEVTRNDALKTAANQSIVETTFCAGLVQVYPSAETDPQSEILAAIDGFNVAVADQLASSVDVGGAVERATAAAAAADLFTAVSVSLDFSGVTDTFTDLQAEITGDLDALIAAPSTLGAKIAELISAPARALTAIETRLNAFSALIDALLGSPSGLAVSGNPGGISLLTTRQRAANAFHLADAFALCAVAGATVAAVADPVNASGQPQPGANYTTRPQAIKAAQTLQAIFEAVVAWRDESFAALGEFAELGTYQVDTGEAYQAIQNAVGLALGFLVQNSFSLRPERRIVIDRPRTIVDLAAQLYRQVDDSTLDFLIDTNQLTGSEILELPRGRSISYYV